MNVKQAIESADGRIILIVHCFSVLASIVAANVFPDRIAGALYVAPADPSRFSLSDYVDSETGFGPWPQGLDLYNDVLNLAIINDREW